MVAPLGIAAALVMLVSGLLSACWISIQHHRVTQAVRAEEVRSVAEMLVNSATVMIARDDLASLRQVVVQSAMAHHLDHCRVTLGDQQVIADSDPSGVNLITLPDTWSAGAATSDVPTETRQGSSLAIRYPATVSQRGDMFVEVAGSLSSQSSDVQTMAGLGMIGAAGLVSMLLVYRHTRRRVQRVDLIRDALLALADPTTPVSAAFLDESFGPEARTWNRILSERQEMSEAMLAQQADTQLSAGAEHIGELKAACDSLWQGLLIADDNLQVKYANGAAAAFLQMPRDKISGENLAQLKMPAEVLDTARQSFASASPTRRTIEIERDEDGTNVVLRYTIRSIKNGDAPHVLVIMDDATQQRVADAARHSFIAQATHELRMPLTNIRLYLETALNEGENDQKLRGECLNVANQESRRLERMVADMLSVAEIEAGSLKIARDDVRLDTLFKELEDDYRAQAREKGIALKFNLPPKLPAIQADRGKLELALHNLIGNAIKYTPEQADGSVTVQVDVKPRLLSVEVRDTGIGVAPEEAQKIFEKFYRAKDKRVGKITGSGLGLALAREIARLHGGDITLESEPDKGSAFTLTIPISAEAV